MPDPPEDEGLKTVRRDGPVPHLVYGDLARPDPELVVAETKTSSMSMLTFAGLFLLVALAAIFVAVRFYQRGAERRKPAIEAASPEVSVAPSTTPPSWATGTIIPVFPEMLKVTSVAMGRTPLAIVNGQRLATGDWLEVKTDRGVATLVVQKIDEGVVHFRNGDMTIDARLGSLSTPKPL
jgi:hypothetical protein